MKSVLSEKNVSAPDRFNIQRQLKHAAAEQSARSPDKKRLLAYRFDPLIERMIDKFGWNQVTAEAVFEDTKKFLYLCAASDQPVCPSPIIDEMWHNFILFTEDYYKFCIAYAGGFIHHRPHRRNERTKGNLQFETLQLANEVFAPLSDNWKFPSCQDDPPSGGTDCDCKHKD